MVSEDKIRIAFTVDKAIAEQVKADIKALNLPPATLSNLVDEWLTSFAPVLHHLAEKKRRGEQLSFDEVMGTVIEGMGRSLKG